MGSHQDEIDRAVAESKREKLLELARSIFGMAKGFIEDGQGANPTFILIDPNAIIPVSYENVDDKDRVFGTMRHIIKKSGASAYVFVCEAWMLKLDKGEAYTGQVPSESPNRIDSLQIDAWNRDGHHVVMCAEIKQTDEGRRVCEPEVMTTTQTVGRAANLFEETVYHGVQ